MISCWSFAIYSNNVLVNNSNLVENVEEYVCVQEAYIFFSSALDFF